MELSREQVEHIAHLARLGLTEAEIEKFQSQLSHILENFEILKELDTANVPPTAQSISMHNVFRKDEATASYSKDDILANAPQQENNYFKIPPVLS